MEVLSSAGRHAVPKRPQNVPKDSVSRGSPPASGAPRTQAFRRSAQTRFRRGCTHSVGAPKDGGTVTRAIAVPLRAGAPWRIWLPGGLAAKAGFHQMFFAETGGVASRLSHHRVAPRRRVVVLVVRWVAFRVPRAGRRRAADPPPAAARSAATCPSAALTLPALRRAGCLARRGPRACTAAGRRPAARPGPGTTGSLLARFRRS